MNTEMPPRITSAPIAMMIALLPLRPLPPEVDVVDGCGTLGAAVVV
jgi:hypothetical protein